MVIFFVSDANRTQFLPNEDIASTPRPVLNPNNVKIHKFLSFLIRKCFCFRGNIFEIKLEIYRIVLVILLPIQQYFQNKK